MDKVQRHKEGLCDSHAEHSRPRHPAGTAQHQPLSIPVQNPQRTGPQRLSGGAASQH